MRHWRPVYVTFMFLLFVLALGSCKQQPKPGPPDVTDVSKTGVVEVDPKTGASASSNPDEPAPEVPAPAGLSLFNPKQEIHSVPLSWALSRDGSMLTGLTQYVDRDTWVAVRWHLTSAGADQPVPIAKTSQSLINFLAANPDGSECLVATLTQFGKTQLADDFWRTSGVDAGSPSGIPMPEVKYLNSVKLPAAVPAGALEHIPAFYSWDGKLAVLPVAFNGIVVADIAAGKARYVDFPSMGGVPAMQSEAGVLPDQNGKRLIYASLSYVESGKDMCQIQVLNLDTLQWEHVQRLDWVVYQVAGDDLDHKPWILLGSRAKQVTSEPGRVPQLGRYHPDTKQIDLLPTFGDIVWTEAGDFLLDAHGQYVVYVDDRRQGLVRLELATGKLDLDPRWFTRSGQLLIDEHASTVLLIKDNTIMRADWSKHEDVPGYAAK